MRNTGFTGFFLAGLLAFPGQGENKARSELHARVDGADVRVAIQIRIEPTWHLYHGPTLKDMSPDGAIGKPTVVDLTGDGIEWSDVRFPKAKPHVQQFGPDEPVTHILQHEGTIVLFARGKIAAGKERPTIGASISGLTCVDEGTCVPYEETLEDKGPGSDELFKSFPADLSVDGAETSAPTAVPDPVEVPGNEGLWLFLLSAVGWGLFTLLMPCTYPMIPITISYFTKQASQRHTSTLPLSLFYGVGIVAVFVLIGVAVGPLIILFAVHPVTNLVIGLLFLVFALTLFGVMELRPPGFLLAAAGQASMRGGYAGVFLMGATLVVTSFTCTAPFVGTLLAQGASSGGVGRIALGMAVFGATMAIPFAFLSMLPGKVKSMPRSGEWMHTLKVTLGFIEVAAALKFLSNADLVWDWGWLSRELFLFLWLAIFVVAALYLLGVIRLKDEAAGEIGPGRMIAGLCFAMFALYCGYGAVGNRMDPIMTAIIPNYSARIADLSGGATKGSSAHAIVKDDFEAALERARTEGKRLLANFTGFT